MSNFPFRKIRVCIFWTSALLFISLVSPAQARLHQLPKALPSLIDSSRIPGISIALIENGVVTWADGKGVKNRSTAEPVTATTIFRGASLGKPVFAYAVLKLAAQGKLDLDKSLMTYIPQPDLENQYLKGKLTDDRIRQITARMVLSHTSGLPNWRAEGQPLNTLFVPGSRYSYSGEGYFFLQHVVEHLTQEPIEAFMQRTVFKPMGMHHTSFTFNSADSVRYVSDHDATGKVVTISSEKANVAHTLRTTASDYASFLTTMMAEEGSTSPILTSPQTKTDICQPGQVSWGLGLAIQHAATGDFFCQWAKSPVASGYVIGSVERKTALVYFVNSANQGLRVAERLVNLGLGYDDPLFACFGVKSYNAKSQ